MASYSRWTSTDRRPNAPNPWHCDPHVDRLRFADDFCMAIFHGNKIEIYEHWVFFYYTDAKNNAGDNTNTYLQWEIYL